MTNDILTAYEAAELLRIDYGTLRKMCSQGKIPYQRVKTPFLGHARLTGSPERYGLPNTKLGAEEAERRAIEEAMNGRPYVAAIDAAGDDLGNCDWAVSHYAAE